jgi:hypothetical protein
LGPIHPRHSTLHVIGCRYLGSEAKLAAQRLSIRNSGRRLPQSVGRRPRRILPSQCSQHHRAGSGRGDRTSSGRESGGAIRGPLSSLTSVLGGTPGASKGRGASLVPLPPSAPFFAAESLIWPVPRGADNPQEAAERSACPAPRAAPRGSDTLTHQPEGTTRTRPGSGRGYRGAVLT